jgi:transcriptional regulator with XRE-family HTH domain
VTPKGESDIMSDLQERLLAEFHDREFRHAYLEDFLNSVVSAQIRTLREEKGWSQSELADLIATTQSAISRNESPDYSRWNIATLRKLARAFDRALIVKFAGFGEALGDIERFRRDRLTSPSFNEDPAFKSDAATSVGTSGNWQSLPDSGKLLDFTSRQRRGVQIGAIADSAVTVSMDREEKRG